MAEKKAKVVLNQQHTLLPDQERVLNEEFGEGGWEILPVPPEGWSLEEQKMGAMSFEGEDVVFASPVPALMKILSWAGGGWEVANDQLVNHCPSDIWVRRVLVFHNDRREAKEISLPGGRKKMIHTVAKTGWVLV